jgi:hypothetical protein
MILEPATALCNLIQFATADSIGSSEHWQLLAWAFGIRLFLLPGRVTRCIPLYGHRIPILMRPRSVLGHSAEYKESSQAFHC